MGRNRFMRRVDVAPATGAAIGALSAIGLAALLVPFRDHVANTSVALLLVLPVLLGATIGGRRGGAVTAIVATLSFNFFHTKPYLSLKMDSADDVETALLLLVVAIVVGTVAARRSYATQVAVDGIDEVHAVHQIAELTARRASARELIDAARHELSQLLFLSACEFELPNPASKLPRLLPTGVLSTSTFHYVDGGFELPSGVDLPVRADGQDVGRFVLFGTPGRPVSIDRRMIAVVLAGQVGATLASQGWPEHQD